MTKTKTKGILSRKDLIGIAKVANLSESTLIKWYDGSLTVKPETELKIYEAANLYYKQETQKLKSYIQGLTDIQNRISETKRSFKQALEIID
jgi:hypothetical protein